MTPDKDYLSFNANLTLYPFFLHYLSLLLSPRIVLFESRYLLPFFLDCCLCILNSLPLRVTAIGKRQWEVISTQPVKQYTFLLIKLSLVVLLGINKGPCWLQSDLNGLGLFFWSKQKVCAIMSMKDIVWAVWILCGWIVTSRDGLCLHCMCTCVGACTWKLHLIKQSQQQISSLACFPEGTHASHSGFPDCCDFFSSYDQEQDNWVSDNLSCCVDSQIKEKIYSLYLLDREQLLTQR